jgi:antitoxin (DNA-binding transcriptional repressor) of toxin-antitoxin stability system
MKKLTVQQVEENFDEIMSRVEKGESFVITSEFGDAMLIPFNQYKEVDDLIRIHTDHEEGC